MDKYCSYCGRELNEGEICSCANYQINEEQTQKKGLFLSISWKLFKDTFKNPTKTINGFVKNKDYKLGIFFIILSSILISIIRVMRISHISYLNNVFGFYFSTKSFIYLFLNVVFQLGIFALFGLYIILFTSIILSQKIDYKKSLSVVGVQGITLIPFLIVGILISFFYPEWGNNLVSMGEILGYFFTYFAFKSSLENKCEKTEIYVIFLALLCEMATKTIFNNIVSILVYGNSIIF